MESPFGFEKKPATNPEEELTRLREAALHQAEHSHEQGIEQNSQKAAESVVEHYSSLPTHEVLHPDYSLSEQESETFALALSPEEHDGQMHQLISLLQEKGIKNAMNAVARLNNPHLLDDFHRFLVALVASGHAITELSEKHELWKPLHMTLFEVSLPEVSEADRQKSLRELISAMEQFYSGMLSVTGEKGAGWFSVEVAKQNGSEEFIFYVSVPSMSKALFEKQILAIFPGAHVHEHPDDYNIFHESGVSVASCAKFEKHFLYPLKPYESFDTDPLGIILNSFSKIDQNGEGAALQFIIGARKDSFTKAAEKAIERIRKGEKVSAALDEIDRSSGAAVAKELFGIFKSQKQAEREKEEKTKRAGAVDQTAIDLFQRKIKSPLVSVNIRAVASAATETEASSILQDIESSFNQFEDGHGNRITWRKVEKAKLAKLIEQFSLRTFDERERIILNLEELTTCMHFPATQVGRAAPQLRQSKAGTAPAPIGLPKEGILLGTNVHRGEETPIRMTPNDRLRHIYTIGQTGTGKTTILKNMIAQDILNGDGVCLLDPHGADIQDILSIIPPERFKDVIYFDPAYTERPMALNMLEYDHRYPEQKTFVVNEMLSIFNKLFDMKTAGGPMFEQYFRNATMLVVEDPESGSTLVEVSRVLSNKAFRELKLSRCKNPIVVQFWKEVAEKAQGEAALANIVPYITSKFDVFLSNEIMRPIISQEHSVLDFRRIMDERKILLVNLAKGRLGDLNSNLIGLIVVGKILMAALSRVDSLGSSEMHPFYLYIDEFQNVTTDSIATILSEARKYKLSLNIAHQFIAQLPENIRDAVFGNVGSIISYRVGAEDAEFLEKQFSPVFTAKDLMSIENYHAYVKLLVNGSPVKPFNIRVAPPLEGDKERIDALKELSYLTYGKPREEVEKAVMEKFASLSANPRPSSPSAL